MKKIATGVTLTAALGLSLFAAAPAQAELPYFESCAAANAAGYGNFVPGDGNFDGRRDPNHNDIVCEKDGLPRTDGSVSGGHHDPTDQALPDEAYTYPDCADAYAAGVFNIPATSEDYHDDLDSDQDGVGCEYNVQYGVAVEGREDEAAEEIAAIKASAKEEDVVEEQQVSQVPAGAVDAGVAPDSDPAAALTVGALGLAAVAGAGVAARRRARA